MNYWKPDGFRLVDRSRCIQFTGVDKPTMLPSVPLQFKTVKWVSKMLSLVCFCHISSKSSFSLKIEVIVFYTIYFFLSVDIQLFSREYFAGILRGQQHIRLWQCLQFLSLLNPNIDIMRIMVINRVNMNTFITWIFLFHKLCLLLRFILY